MNDGTAGFADPAKLKAYFEEIDEEIANLHDLFQGARAQNMGLKVALMAILTASDDILPAVRPIVLQALEEEYHRLSRDMPAGIERLGSDAELDALNELRVDIDLANRLFDRE